MEIVKSLQLPATPAAIWKVLLDPQAMATCVPGMASVEVLSDTEYLAVMKVKISFINATFRLKTRIVQMDEPNYLRAEGTGEDSSVASALKQVSEMWIRPVDEQSSELQIKVVVDLLGRMGTFGLSVMKTKADRMWAEYGENLAKRLQAGEAVVAPARSASAPAPADSAPTTASPSPATSAGAIRHATPPAPVRVDAAPTSAKPSLLGKLFGRKAEARSGDLICLQFRNGNTELNLEWPTTAAEECRRLVVELAKLGTVNPAP